MLSECLKEKINYVHDLNEVLVKYHTNIAKIEYQVFTSSDNRIDGEFLVVNYTGGAKSVKNCGANSLTSILRELTKLVDHCYYDEIEDYEKYYYYNQTLIMKNFDNME